MQRPIDLVSEGARVEGITIADVANNSIHIYGGSYNSNTPVVVDWVKIFTWRVNGDGIQAFARGVIDNVSGTNTFADALVLPPSSPPILTGVTYGSGGSLSFSITNAGGVYWVQTHTNLADEAGWITISTNTAPFTYTDTNVLGGVPQRFYRVVTP
jgi:hypothetical protein